MALDQTQKQTILNHLQRHVQGGCPICGGEMGIEDNLVVAPLYEGGDMRAGGVPSVIISCEDCGNIQFFAAEIVGIDPQNV